MFVGKFWWGGANAGWRYEGQWKGGVENGQGTKWKPDGSVHLIGNFTGPNSVSCDVFQSTTDTRFFYTGTQIKYMLVFSQFYP